MSTTASQTRHTVTAVIVTHDGVQMLPGLFRALATQTYPIDRTVGVDTGSRDHTVSLLAELIGRDAVLSMPRGTGFGEAVAKGLAHSAASRALRTDPDMRRVEWIWLLHDDCEPAPDALERLVRAAGRDRSVAILGPKALDAADRRTLRETGVAIDRAGRRITGIEPGEIDQGQHDGNRAVLAVGSAGMLVRRDVWDRLGGFDTNLVMFRDDLDFCWRAHGAGYRVHVVTDAVLYHHELSARRRGGRRAEGPGLRRLNRRNALYVLAVNLPLRQMLGVLAGCVAGSLLRAAWFLLTKQKDLAAAQAYAAAWLFLHPVRLWQGRRRRAAGRRQAYDSVRSFIPSGRTLPRLAEGIAGLLSSGPPPVTGGRHHAVSATSDDEEDAQFDDQQSLVRRIIGYPGFQLIVALTIIALVAERRLLGAGLLGGGALVPAWDGVSGLWSEYLAGFHTVGLGSAASAPPYLAVVALLGTVLGGQAWLAVDILLLGCVPLAGITAYLAARRLVTAVPARVLLAASYALAPVAIGAVASGRLGTAVVFVLLPLIAVSAGRMLASPPRAARRAAWATGLLVALAAAFAPLVWPIAVLLAAVAVVVRRWLWPVSRIDAAIVAVTPFALLFPWSAHLLGSPSALLAEAGIPVGSTGPSLPSGSLLMLSPGGSGLPPFWVTAGLGLAVVAAFGPRRHRLLAGTGWAVATVGYLFAVIVSRTGVVSGAVGASGVSGTGGAGGVGGGWPGAAMAVTALGLLVAAAPVVQWLCGKRSSSGGRRGSEETRGSGERHGSGDRRGSGDWRGLAPAGVLAVAASAPVLAAAFWVAGGVRGPVAPVTQPVLPAFVAASSVGPGQYRTLVLRPAKAGGVDFSVLGSRDPSLGGPELASYGPAGDALSRQVGALVAADGADSGDPGQNLGAFGIRWVLAPGPVAQALAQRLDAASGLVPVSSAPSYDLWQVEGTVARVRAIAPDGTVTAVASGGASSGKGGGGADVPASGGTLVLAEPYGGWTATLNGTALRPLPTPVDGWAQGFTLPKGGGSLAISRNTLARTLSLALELAALLVIGVLAIPGKRDDPAEEAKAIAAARAAQHDRRVARAARTRELTRAAAVRALESRVAQRAVPRLVASFPPGGVPGADGVPDAEGVPGADGMQGVGSMPRASGARQGGVPRVGRILRSVRPRRGKRAESAPAVPPALPFDSAMPGSAVPALPAAPASPVPSVPSAPVSAAPWESAAARESAAPWESEAPRESAASREMTVSREPAAPWETTAPWESAVSREPAAVSREPAAPWETTASWESAAGASQPPQPPAWEPSQTQAPSPSARQERPARAERGAHRGGRHGKPRGRRKGRDSGGER